MANKVQFGIKNVYYSLITVGADGSYTYATPKPLKGAVSLSLDVAGDSSTFYADDMPYYEGVANMGYSGSLEAAKFGEDFLTDIFGQTADDNGVLVERNDVEPKACGLLFEINGDKTNERYELFNVLFNRPAVSTSTIAESKEPQTQTCDLKAMPSADVNNFGAIKGKTTDATDATVKQNWFTSFYVPSAEAAE